MTLNYPTTDSDLNLLLKMAVKLHSSARFSSAALQKNIVALAKSALRNWGLACFLPQQQRNRFWANLFKKQQGRWYADRVFTSKLTANLSFFHVWIMNNQANGIFCVQKKHLYLSRSELKGDTETMKILPVQQYNLQLRVHFACTSSSRFTASSCGCAQMFTLLFLFYVYIQYIYINCFFFLQLKHWPNWQSTKQERWLNRSFHSWRI